MTKIENKKKSKSEASLKGDSELDGSEKLVPSHETQGDLREGIGDGNPGGTLMRQGPEEE